MHVCCCVWLAAKVAHLFDPSKHIIVSCSKGITTDTLEIVSELLKRILPPAIHPRLSYLSGPSFAAEVAAEKPSAVTIAAEVMVSAGGMTGSTAGLGRVAVPQAAHSLSK